MSKKGLKYNSVIVELPKDFIIKNERGDKIADTLTKKGNLTSKKKLKSIQLITGDIDKPKILNEGEEVDYKPKLKKEKIIKKEVKKETIKEIDDFKKGEIKKMNVVKPKTAEIVEMKELRTNKLIDLILLNGKKLNLNKLNDIVEKYYDDKLENNKEYEKMINDNKEYSLKINDLKDLKRKSKEQKDEINKYSDNLNINFGKIKKLKNETLYKVIIKLNKFYKMNINNKNVYIDVYDNKMILDILENNIDINKINQMIN